MGSFQSPLFYPIGLIICFYVLSLLAWLFSLILDKTLPSDWYCLIFGVFHVFICMLEFFSFSRECHWNLMVIISNLQITFQYCHFHNINFVNP